MQEVTLRASLCSGPERCVNDYSVIQPGMLEVHAGVGWGTHEELISFKGVHDKRKQVWHMVQTYVGVLIQPEESEEAVGVEAIPELDLRV
jgi:hypothetical protein